MAKIQQENLSVDVLQAEKKSKKKSATPKVKTDWSLRARFRAKLDLIKLEELKKPWMATKSFLNVDTEAALAAWVDKVLTDESLWRQPYSKLPDRMPVVAVDTETYGLDTRIMVDFELKRDPISGVEVCIPIYELNIEIAGVCLSVDGIQGIYIPIFHEEGRNIPVDRVAFHLQRLFDRSHLVFYHAKFDREVMRQTMGIQFRAYPWFEDVQVIHYINDPKAKLDEDTFTGGGEGLKGLSKEVLGIDQIELATLSKVQAADELTPEEQEAVHRRPYWIKTKKKDGILCAKCGEPAKYIREQWVLQLDGSDQLVRSAECDGPDCLTKVKYKPPARHMQHVPFTWVPTEIAVWYAAADAICTWLLWDHVPRPKEPTEEWRRRHEGETPEPPVSMHEEAQRRKRVHQIDGNLIDTLAWIERQRGLIDTERHARLVRWSDRAKTERRARLRELANQHGWEVATDDDGKVIEGTEFNVDSNQVDLPKLLFDIKRFTPTKFTDTGLRSCDKDALVDLLKAHPHDEFLLALREYKEYVALHPEKLSWDKRDKTARIYLKQAVVAGGRLSAAGGEFARDGGLSLNPQAIKSVRPGWWVNGDLLTPDFIREEDVEEHEEGDLHPSCFKTAKSDEVATDLGELLRPDDPRYPGAAEAQGFKLRNGKWTKKAPGILRNHIGNYLGYAMCLVPKCTTCAAKHGVLIKKTRLDAAQIINFRQLFIAPKGWTYLTTDYSNVEVRGAANVSGETELQKIFLEGDGDHHTLTASKIFPEFNDPHITPARRKELRGVAKIINFALQYGGTEYTIYENLKPLIPDITMKKTREMVDAYWKGVPQFALWAREKQREAREELTCTTVFNRIIKFQSLMDLLHITKPTKEQEDCCFQYYRIRKQYRLLVDRLKDIPAEASLSEAVQELQAEMLSLKTHMDNLWADRETGVRNAVEYNRFIGKIQRVAMNAPIQGMAGDFMRMSLNRICKWATALEPLVQAVFRLHNTVHDEIDYTIKNPYLPFVVPRLSRMMKLRALHARMEWPVPLEADTEYGPSWDVEFHLTGDADHVPAGWTRVSGMENYLPQGFTMAEVERLTKAIASGKEALREKVLAWAKAALHPRAFDAFWFAVWYRDKDKNAQLLTDTDVIRRQVIAAIQLHEYWVVDGTPDGDEATMETFEQFEQRCGLSAADRGWMPEGGWLHSVPQDKVRRKVVPILGPRPVETTPPPETPDQGTLAFQDDELKLVCETPAQEPEPVAAPIAAPPAAPPPAAEDELFYETPRKREQPAPEAPVDVPALEPAPAGIPHLRHLNEEDATAFFEAMGYRMGKLSIDVIYDGHPATFTDFGRTEIPERFLEVKHA